MTKYDYDLVVIGSGPGGIGAADQATKLGKRVAVVERAQDVGSVAVNIATPSKSLREAVVYLTGYRKHNVYGESYAVNSSITISDLKVQIDYVTRQHADRMRRHLIRTGADLISAEASFDGRHSIRLTSNSDASRVTTADKIIIAVGTRSTRPSTVYADGQIVFVSDDVLDLAELPQTLTVVGAGAVGLEYASIFAELGIRVTVVDKRARFLTFMDDELVDNLTFHMRQKGIVFRMQEEVFDIEYFEDERGKRVRVFLDSGKQIVSDAVMYCVGRTGSTQRLNLEAADIEATESGHIVVDEAYRTGVDNIFAVGGVIGFPDLVATSEMQGRLAALHAFGADVEESSSRFPYYVKTIPEIAMVGSTEAQLTESGVAYEVGKASYRESISGIIRGTEVGQVKLLFSLDTRRMLGVHIIGEESSELIHVGQAVMAHEGTIDYFLRNTISYPTLSECYVAASMDGLSRL